MFIKINKYAVLTLVCFLSACQPGNSLEPTLTTTPTNMVTATATYTPLPPTPTPEPTLTFTPTPTKIGGSNGQLLISGVEQLGEEWTIYQYDLLTHQTELIIKDYILQDILPDGQTLLISKNIKWEPCDYNAELYIFEKDKAHPTLLSENFRPTTSDNMNAAWLPGTDLLIFRSGDDKPFNLYSYDHQGNTQQFTFSELGVIDFIPSLHDGGVFWKEGQCNESQGRVSSVREFGWRWSKLDGSETKVLDYLDKFLLYEISPDGKYSIGWSPPFMVGEDIENPSMTITISMTDGTLLNQVDLSKLLTNSPPGSQVTSLKWFPKSDRVLVGYSDEQLHRYLIISTEGKLLNELNETQLMKENFYPALESRTWSPDGRLLLFDNQGSFLEEHALYIWDYENHLFIEEPLTINFPARSSLDIHWWPAR